MMRRNAIGSPHTHLASTPDRAEALEACRVLGSRYVVRVDAAKQYFVVPKGDPGYAAMGVIVTESQA